MSGKGNNEEKGYYNVVFGINNKVYDSSANIVSGIDNDLSNNKNQIDNKPSESTIEIKAEEIK